MCDVHTSEADCPSNFCTWTGDRCRARDTREVDPPKYPRIIWLTNMRPLTNLQRGGRFCVWVLIILVLYILCRLVWHQSTSRVRALWQKQKAPTNK